MARDLEVDLARFLRGLEDAAEAIADGAKRGLHDALDDWQREARDIAPLDKRVLRDSIEPHRDIKGEGLVLTAEIHANATERKRNGERFNYAYYIHERDAGGKSLRTPGTVKKFLDVAAERNEAKWMRDIESEIESELKQKGW